MTVFENEGRWDASNVWFEAGEIRRYDKKIGHRNASHRLRIAVLCAEVLRTIS